jgi:thiol-disulfide isomerase/thioredoxin
MSSATPRWLGSGRPILRLSLSALAIPIVLALAGLAAAGTPATTQAPAFTTTDPAGANRTLAQYLNAKPILLEFMSPDCPHCVEMAPILGRVHKIYGDRVQFLTVAYDKSAKRIQQFAQLEKHVWPYLLGTQEIVNAYRLEGVPTFYFLAPDGRIVNVVVGSMPEQTLREHLDALLKAK